jgi:hypothetical protein
MQRSSASGGAMARRTTSLMSPGAFRLVAQPSVVGTHHVVRVRQLLYQGLWRHLGTEGDTEEDRQQLPVRHPRHRRR